MRLLVVAFASMCSLLACGGAESQDVLTASTATSGGGSSGAAGSSGTSGTSGTPSTSGTLPSDCPREDEPNDDAADANELDPVRCGTVSASDEVDFLTFKLKSSTKSLALTFTGRVRLRVTVKGQDAIEITPEKPLPVPFVRGEEYTVQVTRLTEGTSEEPWRVTLVER